MRAVTDEAIEEGKSDNEEMRQKLQKGIQLTEEKRKENKELERKLHEVEKEFNRLRSIMCNSKGCDRKVEPKRRMQ